MKLVMDLRGRCRRAALAVMLLALGAAAFAADLPAWYPEEGFQRTGRIDALIPEEQRIVINDISYPLADNVIVHTPNAFSVPKSRLRTGVHVGYRVGGGRRIVELWMLPRDFDPRRGR